MKNFFKNLFKDPDTLPADKIKTRQYGRVALLSGVALGSLVLGLGFFKSSSSKEESSPIKTTPQAQKLIVPSESVDVRDIWARRVERRAEEAEQKASNLEASNDLLTKRLETVEEILTKGSPFQSESEQIEASAQKDTLSSPSKMSAPIQASNFKGFPQEDMFTTSVPQSLDQSPHADSGLIAPRLRIMHQGLEKSPKPLKKASHYVPAGSYAKAVLTSGAVVSTAVASQSNPQPIVLRLADEGLLPRGFQSHMKDAVLIGSCYGDLSAERAMCRLHTLSFIEPDGTTVERSVEGWIIGEDGAPGLRGKIVDRAGEVAREAFLSGILSGMSSFLQFDATRSVYPITPFGQTSALSPKDAVTGGLGKGASNALDKLAEFSIKRAEAMQPVIVVNGGRVVDVVFKRGIDLIPDPAPEIKLVTQPHSSNQEVHP